MEHLKIRTRSKRQIVDITDRIASSVPSGRSGVANIVVLHTTAALTTADLDPGTDLDMLDAFEAIMPKLRYRHPHDPAHVPDHILSALIGTSVTMLVENGSLLLGTWQRIVLVELDGPRERDVACAFTPAE